MVTRSSTSTASHGAVVDGADQVVRSFLREAVTIAPKAAAVTVAVAAKAAQRMRNRVPIGPPTLHVLNSITSDTTPNKAGAGVYADAGPDPTADAGAFVGRFLEHGTVKMAPRPFVGPAGDETLPEFIEAMRKLPGL